MNEMETIAVTLTPQKLERAAYVLKAVAHPVRIGIVDLLNQRSELSVGELTEALEIEQASVSHHLIKMRDKGILDTRRDGRNIYYHLTDETITNIIGCIKSCKTF